MKLTFILIFLNFFNYSQSAKFKQRDYKEQYEQCLVDYQKMYKMMEDKLTIYSDNENSLLASVKNTIFKAYKQSETMSTKINIEKEKFEDKIKNFEQKLIENDGEYTREKQELENNIKKLTHELAVKVSLIENLESQVKLLQANYNNSTASISRLSKEADSCKQQLLANKKNCEDKVDDYISKLNSIKIMKSNTNLISPPSISDKAAEVQSIVPQEVKNQITKIENINTSLNLIENKLNTLNSYDKINSTIISDEEENSFLELKSKNKNYNKMLDIVLLNNIEKSRDIYSRIGNLIDMVSLHKESKDKCEDKLKGTIRENLDLKEALAELEVKFRIR